jgi:predicted O-methyltransferase YrrM
LPGPWFRCLKGFRHSLSGNRHLSPGDRAAQIAELAEPVRTRSRGWTDVFRELEKLGLHLYPNYFYSPIPDTREIDAERGRIWRETDMSVVRYNRDEEARLNAAFAAMTDELAGLPTSEQLKSAGLGLGYGEVEAALLYKMIRHLRPRRVVEVGSGVSTYYTAQALAANLREGHAGTLTCIEPYASDPLKKSGLAFDLLEKPVQDVEPALFRELGDGDVLFIDSSHVVRIGSDVNYLLLDVIPSLNPGVVVHLHDIPFPYITPPEHWVLDRLMFWQEPVLLKALLTHNSTLEITYCCSFLARREPQNLKLAFPCFDPRKHSPSSIWLKKTG